MLSVSPDPYGSTSAVIEEPEVAGRRDRGSGCRRVGVGAGDGEAEQQDRGEGDGALVAAD